MTCPDLIPSFRANGVAEYPAMRLRIVAPVLARHSTRPGAAPDPPEDLDRTWCAGPIVSSLMLAFGSRGIDAGISAWVT
jgi:hypothetical protein